MLYDIGIVRTNIPKICCFRKSIIFLDKINYWIKISLYYYIDMNNNKLNTKNFGIAKIIIFPYKKGYRAVCLNFDLIEDAKTIKEVKKQIEESVMGYIENICKNKLDNQLLNRHADEKYWKIFEEHCKFISSKRRIKEHFSRNIRNSSILTIPVLELFNNSNCEVA